MSDPIEQIPALLTHVDEVIARIKAKRDGDVSGATDGPRLIIRSMSSVAPKEIDWLWRRWLARGHFQLFGGLSGDGKGTIMTNIAAIGSVGGRWPDGSQAPRFNTLFVVGEEGLGTTLRPRLDLHGADCDHIFALETVLDGEGRDRSFNVRNHLDLLEAAIREYRIDLVVIDPLTTIMPGTNRNDEGDTRDALTPLVKLAERTNVCIKGIAHIGKPNGTTRTTAQRILGATAFHALARIVWITAKDGERGMALGVPLSNIALKPKPLLWSRAEDEPISWDGESETSIDALFDGMKLEMPHDKAEGLLRDLFSDGAKPSYVVEAAAKEAGCAWATIRRAGDTLGVIRWRPKGDTRWWWRLPDGAPQDGAHQQVAQPFTYGGEQVEQLAPETNLLTSRNDEQVDGMTPKTGKSPVDPGSEVKLLTPRENDPVSATGEQLDASNLLTSENGEQHDGTTPKTDDSPPGITKQTNGHMGWIQGQVAQVAHPHVYRSEQLDVITGCGDPTKTESALPGFPVSWLPDIPTTEEIPPVRQFDTSIVRQSKETSVASITSVNSAAEPLPPDCGAPESCQKLGPCHVFLRDGQCWSVQGKETA